ncbi:hypothetical protein MHBO_004717, partial [Bonamia ostreae]
QSCAITNQPALYRDSVTLLPFSDKNAFSKIRRALKDKKIVPFRRSKLFRSYTIRVKKPKGWERKKIFSRKFVSYKNICFRLNKNDNEKNVKINLGKLRKLVSTQTFNTKIKTIKTDSHLKLKDSIFKDRIKNETESDYLKNQILLSETRMNNFLAQTRRFLETQKNFTAAHEEFSRSISNFITSESKQVEESK